MHDDVFRTLSEVRLTLELQKNLVIWVPKIRKVFLARLKVELCRSEEKGSL